MAHPISYMSEQRASTSVAGLPSYPVITKPLSQHSAFLSYKAIHFEAAFYNPVEEKYFREGKRRFRYNEIDVSVASARSWNERVMLDCCDSP